MEAAATYFLRADGSLRSLDLAANYRVTVIRDRREATNREFMKIATSRIALSGVRKPPQHATGIEHYLNNCYVCILSAIIPIDVNSVIAVARRSTNLNLTTLALARRVFISKFN